MLGSPPHPGEPTQCALSLAPLSSSPRSPPAPLTPRRPTPPPRKPSTSSARSPSSRRARWCSSSVTSSTSRAWRSCISRWPSAAACRFLQVTDAKLARKWFDVVPAKFDKNQAALADKLIALPDVRIEVERRDDVLKDVAVDRRTAFGESFNGLPAKSFKRGTREVFVGNGLFPTKEAAKAAGVSEGDLKKVFEAGLAADGKAMNAAGEAVRSAMQGKDVTIESKAGTSLKVKVGPKPMGDQRRAHHGGRGQGRRRVVDDVAARGRGVRSASRAPRARSWCRASPSTAASWSRTSRSPSRAASSRRWPRPSLRRRSTSGRRATTPPVPARTRCPSSTSASTPRPSRRASPSSTSCPRARSPCSSAATIGRAAPTS